MDNDKWARVTDPADPNRCQATTPLGQCNNVAMSGSQFCPAHGGNQGHDKKKATELRNYKLSKFKARATELGNSSAISSLRDEVALLRLMAEQQVNVCENSTDLLLQSGPLSDLFMKISTTVEKCANLELKLGQYLDKEKILGFAQSIVGIISKHITDEDILTKISTEILENLENLE